MKKIIGLICLVLVLVSCGDNKIIDNNIVDPKVEIKSEEDIVEKVYFSTDFTDKKGNYIKIVSKGKDKIEVQEGISTNAPYDFITNEFIQIKNKNTDEEEYVIHITPIEVPKYVLIFNKGLSAFERIPYSINKDGIIEIRSQESSFSFGLTKNAIKSKESNEKNIDVDVSKSEFINNKSKKNEALKFSLNIVKSYFDNDCNTFYNSLEEEFHLLDDNAKISKNDGIKEKLCNGISGAIYGDYDYNDYIDNYNYTIIENIDYISKNIGYEEEKNINFSSFGNNDYLFIGYKIKEGKNVVIWDDLLFFMVRNIGTEWKISALSG